MNYQYPTPDASRYTTTQPHPTPNSFQTVNNGTWSNQYAGYGGTEMKHNGHVQNNWNGSLSSQPPPPLHQNNISQMPPSQFHSTRPPPVLYANRGPSPAANTNRLPQPTNFYQPPPQADTSRPPPPLPNHSPQVYQPPQQQRFPASNTVGAFNANQHQFSINQSQPSFMPPKHDNASTIISSPYDFELQQKRPPSFQVDNVRTPNVSAAQESYESEIGKKRRIGQERLASWLQKNSKAKKKVCNIESKEKPPGVKLNGYLSRLQKYMAVIAEMSGQVDKLDSMVLDANKSSWQQECCVMDSLKDKHKDLKSVLDKVVVEQVEKKLSQIKHKKARLERLHCQQYQEMQELEESRQRKEKEISDWQQQLLTEMKEDLMKKKRKQEMDQTLSEVTKKINDANRLIDTMTALEKLRLIRQDAAKKRGDSDIGESRESFEQKISDMTRLVRGQLEVYREEEDKLRRMIKSEQEETSKKEKELQASKVEEEQRQKDDHLRKILFGFSEDADISDPLFPYQQYYKQAQTSLPAFVQIRHEWDQYTVLPNDPTGSSIQAGWIPPPDPSSSDWASALT